MRLLRRYLLFCLIAAGCVVAAVRGTEAEPSRGGGPALGSILEAEAAARLLAILLDAGRGVINENQDLFDDPARSDKGFSPGVFEEQLDRAFHSRVGLLLHELDSSRLPARTKQLLRALVEASKQVVAEAQPDLNRAGVGYKGFIPAVFGTRVAGRFQEKTGVRLKQTALVPRNPANAPDVFEQAALGEFAQASYPREKVITEIVAGTEALRLMYPLYTTRRCLDCHGQPKGELDRTGHPKEGLRLGDNAGAISVVIPIQP